MTSNRPYLIRALYEWLVDNELTPYLLVDANHESVHVPSRYVEEGRIVLNVSPSAVRELSLGNDLIAFEARPSPSLCLHRRSSGCMRGRTAKACYSPTRV